MNGLDFQRIKVFFLLAILPFFPFEAKDSKKKLCRDFSDCLAKAETTDVHRRKIQFFTEAESLWESKDTEEKLYSMLFLKANSIVKEALGDSGYKGETVLKVTHTANYKKEQFEKANSILIQLESKRTLFSESEWKEIQELTRIVHSG